jgi:hypothetical protein
MHYRRYRDGRAHEAVETEALRQTALQVRQRLDELLPEPLSPVQEREERQRRQAQFWKFHPPPTPFGGCRLNAW